MDANSIVVGLGPVAASYGILFGGAALVAYGAWAINDVKAVRYSLPGAPWYTLISVEYSEYVRKVAAEAFLQHAESTGGKTEMGDLIRSIGEVIRIESNTFIRIRLTAAYMVFAMGQRKEDNVEDENEDDSSVKARVGTIWKKRMSFNTSGEHAVGTFNSIRMWFNKYILRVGQRSLNLGSEHYSSDSPKKSPSNARGKTNRRIRKALGTFKVIKFSDCLQSLISSMTNKSTSTHIQSGIANAILLAVRNADADSYFAIDLENPSLIHALFKAHIFNIARYMQKNVSKFTVNAILDSMDYLESFMHQLREQMQGKDQRNGFGLYFFTQNSSEDWSVRTDVSHILMSTIHMVLFSLRVASSKIKADEKENSRKKRPRKRATVHNVSGTQLADAPRRRTLAGSFPEETSKVSVVRMWHYKLLRGRYLSSPYLFRWKRTH